MLDGVEPDAKKAFLDQLNKPPASLTVEQVKEVKGWEDGAAGNDFLAQMRARGGAGRVSVSGTRNVEA